MATLSPPSTAASVADKPPSSLASAPKPRRKRLMWICVGVAVAIGVVVAIVLAVLITNKVINVKGSSSADASPEAAVASPSQSSEPSSDSDRSAKSDPNGQTALTRSARPSATATSTRPSSTSSAPESTSVSCPKKTDIPSAARGTYFDTTAWLDMTDFNCTYTDETVGGLPLVGLDSTWDDSARANPNVPALNKPWGSYNSRPARGVNLGGWLSLEPFITPSLFAYDSSLGVVDEYSLSKYLGAKAAATLEKHYSTFVTEQDFKSIADAGLDHIRIPFSYWAVETYDDDPYVSSISWRYLLRGIEWARKYGLRIKLDLHGLPGSQNSWNHSGRQGKVGFLLGSSGAKNAQRALDIHDKLSKFFAQDRYKNVIAFYGLANEPGRDLDLDSLVSWTAEAYKIIKDNGVSAIQVFSDALRGLPEWQGRLQGYGNSLVVDTHQYVIFDPALLAFKHTAKITFACETWTEQVSDSVSSGFGPTMVGEWSQADTDCTRHLNGVGNGARWTGTFLADGSSPACPTGDKQCSCEMANADPSDYSPEYKLFLKTWAEAQMHAFEKSWGWFYWTWKTESAPLWSYQAGLAAGIMPEKAYQRDWDCSKPIPSFGKLPEFV
ncbi:hypothetical protein DRE_01563 [Drechslerella stenobrocha 248]|uniref:glucan 1,3-beta-glucosidase n=1 Tax=Drechslerella stenobrocha 248 TaxID=1043628 RepID=W7HIG9_9PEZI|nr:hypothetical protein DRE_01563 [Drechslerella stenobrocha 248]